MATAFRKIALILSRNYCTGPFFRRQGAILATKGIELSQERLYTPPPPLAKYGGRHTVTLLPGDGIGPDLMKHVKEVFRVAGVPVDFEEIQLDSHNESNDELEYAIISIKRNGVALKGNIETRINRPNFRSRNVVIRTDLDLFASMLWCKSVPGIETRHKDIDFILIRENTEGEYSSLEHESVNGVVESLKIITREKSMKIAKFAFDQAVKYNRKKVTAVHKANIMKLGDGLFLESCRQVSKDYPDIKFDSLIIDNCSMQMVSHPQQFDVLVMPNLYGNILSNIGCGIVGGPGLLSGRNIGDQYAVFETGSRNTGKSIAGKNVANPIAMFNAASDMLEYLGLDDHASLIRGAILKTLSIDKIHTPDIGGESSTTDVVDNILKEIHVKSSIAAQQ